MLRRGGAINLLTWAHFPRSIDELFLILADTKDDELVEVMTATGGPGSQLAWAEYGRRKYKVPFSMQKGHAMPHHYLPSQLWS